MSENAKEAIRSKINLFIKTNGNKEITAPQVNEILQDVLDSYPNKINDATLLGLCEYDPARAYPAGFGCFHDGRLYKAKVVTTPGGFDIVQWEDVFATTESETTILFEGAWSVFLYLPNVRKVNFFANSSNDTTKVVYLNNYPVEGDIACLTDKKGNAGAYNITVRGNGKLINGVAEILINVNNMSVTLKYDGEDWNII